MNVCALIAAEAVSGPARQLAAVARLLPEHGVAYQVVLTQRNSEVPPLARHLEEVGVPYTSVRDRGPLDWRMIGAVRAILAETGATILQTHGYKASAIGHIIRRLDRTRPWIGFFHGSTNKGPRDRFYQRLERGLLRGADRVVVVSHSQLALFRGHPCAEVIDNAVLPLDPAGMREISVGTGRRPVLGVIGRLSREKGVDLFLQSCAVLRDRGAEFSAVIIGEGPEEQALARLTRDLRLQDRVHFLGHIANAATVYPQVDIVVIPSRSEGLPNVLLEALAANCAIVATRVGAIPDVLRDPDAGTLVIPEDPADLADAIAGVMDRPSSPAQSEARARTVERYSLAARAERHAALYRACAGVPHPALR